MTNTVTPRRVARRQARREPRDLGEERKQTNADGPRCADPPEGEAQRARKRTRATERAARRRLSGTPSPPPDHQRTEAPPRAAARTKEAAERKQAPRPAGPKAEKTGTRASEENGTEERTSESAPTEHPTARRTEEPDKTVETTEETSGCIPLSLRPDRSQGLREEFWGNPSTFCRRRISPRLRIQSRLVP